MTNARRLSDLGTATIYEAASASRLIDAPLRPLCKTMRLAGPARTLRCQPGDNLALHRVIAAATKGDVIIVDYSESTDSGPFGEIMAFACLQRGIAGLVTDGAVRDSEAIVDLGFPVFARGINICGTTKDDAGQIDVPVRLGGAQINPADYIVADADAVIIVPAHEVEATLHAAEARAAAEAGMMRKLRAGETTMTILGLEKETTP